MVNALVNICKDPTVVTNLNNRTISAWYTMHYEIKIYKKYLYVSASRNK